MIAPPEPVPRHPVGGRIADMLCRLAVEHGWTVASNRAGTMLGFYGAQPAGDIHVEFGAHGGVVYARRGALRAFSVDKCGEVLSWLSIEERITSEHHLGHPDQAGRRDRGL